MSNLGANFKKARESLGIPIEKIAAETRISVRFLTAIENEEFRLLPGGIFNRGFIRAYAEHVGLSPDTVLEEYDRLGLSPEEPVEALRTVERESRKNSERHLYPAAAVILLVLIAGYYLVTRNGSPEAAEPESKAEQTVEANSTLPTLTPPVVEAEVPPAETLPEPVPAVVPASSQAPPPAPIPTAAAPASTTSRSDSAAALVLDIDITELSWIKVTADGTVAQSGELPAGTRRRFTANSSIALSVGNAGGTSVRINGRDPGPLGPPGSVRQYTITQENSATIKF